MQGDDRMGTTDQISVAKHLSAGRVKLGDVANGNAIHGHYVENTVITFVTETNSLWQLWT
jgi:hypothetical protein